MIIKILIKNISFDQPTHFNEGEGDKKWNNLWGRASTV